MADLTLFHAPRTRSFSALILLEELGADYDLQMVDIGKEAQHAPAFRAINPMGKVPAIRHRDAVVTEQVAIALYLADLFPEKGLAPAIGDALRGPYLRWMVFYAACFEPAVIDFALKREPGKRAMSPYGEYDTVMDVLTAQLTPGPWLLGDTFSAADVIWGTALQWTTQFKVVPETPLFAAYIARFAARPAMAKARAKDAALTAAAKPVSTP